MNQLFSFLLGFSAGFIVTLLSIHPEKLLYRTKFLSTNNAIYDNETSTTQIFSNETELYEELLAEKLISEVRILCWVLTGPKTHKKKAVHVLRTWSQRCSKLLFMSSQVDPVLGSIALPVGEGRNHLWDKTRHALQYIYDNHFDDAEWFLKVDDDK